MLLGLMSDHPAGSGYLMRKLLNLPELSIKGGAVGLTKENILPVTRLAAHFADQALKLVPDCLAHVAGAEPL